MYMSSIRRQEIINNWLLDHLHVISWYFFSLIMSPCSNIMSFTYRSFRYHIVCYNHVQMHVILVSEITSHVIIMCHVKSSVIYIVSCIIHYLSPWLNILTYCIIHNFYSVVKRLQDQIRRPNPWFTRGWFVAT